jgi:hypothetical protein
MRIVVAAFVVAIVVAVILLLRCRDDVAASLQGLRWEMPCKPQHGDICESTEMKYVKTATLAGSTSSTYDVTLRFRGVVEQNTYAGGSADAYWYVGGHSADGNFNIYELRISAPPQVFYLNAGKAGIANVFPIDYQKTIRMQGGATVTLTADAQDGRLIANYNNKGEPVIVPDVAPAPKPFDGQFIEMDVVSVATGTP